MNQAIITRSHESVRLLWQHFNSHLGPEFSQVLNDTIVFFETYNLDITGLSGLIWICIHGHDNLWNPNFNAILFHPPSVFMNTWNSRLIEGVERMTNASHNPENATIIRQFRRIFNYISLYPDNLFFFWHRPRTIDPLYSAIQALSAHIEVIRAQLAVLLERMERLLFRWPW